jgi:hypothetical protein
MRVTPASCEISSGCKVDKQPVTIILFIPALCVLRIICLESDAAAEVTEHVLMIAMSASDGFV